MLLAGSHCMPTQGKGNARASCTFEHPFSDLWHEYQIYICSDDELGRSRPFFQGQDKGSRHVRNGNETIHTRQAWSSTDVRRWNRNLCPVAAWVAAVRRSRPGRGAMRTTTPLGFRICTTPSYEARGTASCKKRR